MEIEKAEESRGILIELDAVKKKVEDWKSFAKESKQSKPRKVIIRESSLPILELEVPEPLVDFILERVVAHYQDKEDVLLRKLAAL